MNAKCPYNTAVCLEYERLLIACQKTLEAWRNKSKEITGSRSSSREATDKLLRLQADYAKAYSRLETHQNKCELCRFVSEIRDRNSESIPLLQ
jgi:hypothetical protein